MIHTDRAGLFTGISQLFDNDGENSPPPSARTVLAGLFASYFLFVLLRFMLTLLFREPMVFGDELTYRYLAYSFYKHGDFFAIRNYGHVENMNNVLYPLLISPAFFFGNNFYPASKLINCLLINSALFPAYLIMRLVASVRTAFFTSIIVMFLPFFNIANYMMTENLYFPLFLWSFYAMYKHLTTGKTSFLLLAISFLTLLFFTKPTAIVLIAASIVAGLGVLIFPRTPAGRSRQVLKYGIAILLALLTTLFVCRDQIRVLDLFGTYSGAMEQFFTKWDLRNSMVIATSYLASFAFVYLLPFSIALFALGHFAHTKETNNVVFLGFALITAFLYLLSTMKFTLDTAEHEQFYRLHARYYFMIYPLFIFSFIAFGRSIKWDLPKRITLAVCYGLIAVQFAVFFYPNYVVKKSYGFFVDNIDLSGLLLKPKAYIVICTLLTASMTVYYVRMKDRVVLRPFIVLFLCISMVQNIAHVATLRSMHLKDPMTSYSKDSRQFIQQNIPRLDNKVLMIGSGPMPVLSASFWLTYNYTNVLILNKNEEIDVPRVPQGTEYIVLFDDYRISIPYSEVAKRQDGSHTCRIIRTRERVPRKV